MLLQSRSESTVTRTISLPRVLLVHNRYQQTGGEDVGVRDECEVLLNHGHEARILETNNDHIRGFLTQIQTAFTTVYSPSSRRRMAEAIADFRPDIVHVHNFFPVFSPSIYYACNETGIPVVQTLHNYRLLCPGSFFFRDGRVCEDCLGKAFAWPGVLHACYRDSHLGTAAVAAMGSVHRALRTYARRVQVVIALTEFSRKKLIEGGFSADNVVVKPPFVDVDPGVGRGQGGYALFVGRLSEEKGVLTLLEAWRTLGRRVPLRIVGAGVLADRVRLEADAIPGVEYLGFRSRAETNQLMHDALTLIFPSLWYEGVPRTILEAFATGTPVIASRMGAMESLIEHQRSGLHFEPGNSDALITEVEWMLSHPQEWQSMRQLARCEYETKYDAERSYQSMARIYEGVLSRRSPSNAGAKIRV